MTNKFKSYTNKSSLLKRRSRYAQGGISEMRGNFLAWWERDTNIAIPADDDDTILSLPKVYEGRPDILAYDLYGDVHLEWIILQSNNIVDLNEEFITGATIRVPSKRRVEFEILNKNATPRNV